MTQLRRNGGAHTSRAGAGGASIGRNPFGKQFVDADGESSGAPTLWGSDPTPGRLSDRHYQEEEGICRLSTHLSSCHLPSHGPGLGTKTWDSRLVHSSREQAGTMVPENGGHGLTVGEWGRVVVGTCLPSVTRRHSLHFPAPAGCPLQGWANRAK